ncbi:MAG: hypothetical protein ACRDGM_04635, partial [bacterium]
SILITGYVFDDVAPNAVTENRAAAPRMSGNRVPYSILRDAAGNERGANVTAGNALVVDLATIAGTAPTTAGKFDVKGADGDVFVRQTTATNLNAAVVGTGTAGTPAGNILTVQGIASMTKLLVTPDSVALPANQSVNLAQVAGATVTTGNGTAAGSQRVTIASDSTGQVAIASLPNEGTQTAANSISVTVASDIATGATGQPANAAQGLVVRQPVSCTNRIAISQTADTQVVTGTAGQRVYICAIVLIATAAETISIIEGTGTICATSPTAVYGSTTEANGMGFAAGGGFAQASGQPFVHTGVDGNNLCIMQVGTARVSGSISFIVAAD